MPSRASDMECCFRLISPTLLNVRSEGTDVAIGLLVSETDYRMFSTIIVLLSFSLALVEFDSTFKSVMSYSRSSTSIILSLILNLTVGNHMTLLWWLTQNGGGGGQVVTMWLLTAFRDLQHIMKDTIPRQLIPFSSQS